MLILTQVSSLSSPTVCRYVLAVCYVRFPNSHSTNVFRYHHRLKWFFITSVALLGISSPALRNAGNSPPVAFPQNHRSAAKRTFSYSLVAIKLVTPSKEHLEKHYEDLSAKPFYRGLITCTLPLLPLPTQHYIFKRCLSWERNLRKQCFC